MNEWFYSRFIFFSVVEGYGHIAPKTQGKRTCTIVQCILYRIRASIRFELQNMFQFFFLAGKIATIFYAICGIPLMLLCLSNIGDIMASSFRWIRCSIKFGICLANNCSIRLWCENRFIYWRICCFVCTREPKRRRSRRSEFQRSLSQPSRIASARPSIRRSVRVSQRTADSGIDSYCEPQLAHAYSDTELRYNTDSYTYI